MTSGEGRLNSLCSVSFGLPSLYGQWICQSFVNHCPSFLRHVLPIRVGTSVAQLQCRGSQLAQFFFNFKVFEDSEKTVLVKELDEMDVTAVGDQDSDL